MGQAFETFREHIPAIFALLVAAAGWFYLFYSRAASRLASIEQSAINRRRIRLRRVAGIAMILMGVLFFAGFYSDVPALGFLLIWLAVVLLMAIILTLAIIDLRLTLRLRQDWRNRDE